MKFLIAKKPLLKFENKALKDTMKIEPDKGHCFIFYVCKCNFIFVTCLFPFNLSLNIPYFIPDYS